MEIVFVVGWGESGKSTLIRGLRGERQNDKHIHASEKNVYYLNWGKANTPTFCLHGSLNEGKLYWKTHPNIDLQFSSRFDPDQPIDTSKDNIRTISPNDLGVALARYENAFSCKKAILALNTKTDRERAVGWNYRDYDEAYENNAFGGHTVTHVILLDEDNEDAELFGFPRTAVKALNGLGDADTIQKCVRDFIGLV